MVHLKATWISF